MADFAQYDPIPIHGEPGVGIVGTNRYQVGVQSESPDMAAWAARQPNLDRAKATEEANRVAKEGLYLDHLMLNQRTTTSARSVEAAMTFQAMRNYERDYSTAIAAGLSPSQAGFQALSRNPRAVPGAGSVLRALQPVAEPFTPTPVEVPGAGQFIRQGRYGERMVPVKKDVEPFTPTTMEMPGVGTVIRQGRYGERVTSAESMKPFDASEGTLPSGTKYVRTGRGSAQILPSDRLTTSQQATLLSRDITALRNQSRLTPEEKVELASKVAELESIRKGNPASTGQPTGKPIRVRRKSDGKIYPYSGNASDVPLEKYEILPPLP